MPRARKNPDGRGGPRQGQLGRAYPNRTDLTSAPAPGQPYGAVKAQADSMKVVPMANRPAGAAPAPPPAAAPARTISPDETPTFGMPTSRPDEPLTAGLPFGPGRGPQGPAPNPANDDVSDRLRAIYDRYPTDELADLLDELDFG